MKTIDVKLFLKLFLVFIAATVIGTISHELGHYVVAKHFGYSAEISYASASWMPAHANEIVPPQNRFLISLGGPLQTMLTGSIGVILLISFRKKYFASQKLNWKQWTIIFVSLFWLRQTANLVTWLGSVLLTGRFSTRGDELTMAHYLEWSHWSLITFTGIIGLIVLLLVVFKFIPPQHCFTFLAAGFTGGIAGYIFWIVLFGKYIMP